MSNSAISPAATVTIVVATYMPTLKLTSDALRRSCP